VYGKIGVNLFWVQGKAAFETPANALHVYVVIMSQAQAALQTGIHAQEFGIADKHAATAYIYYSRIVDHAGQSWISTGSALGRIIAHEIGHLLLPDGHSKSGIMRDYLNIEPNGLELFEDAQAAAIRAKIDSVGR
jgi:hypothetical protein